MGENKSCNGRDLTAAIPVALRVRVPSEALQQFERGKMDSYTESQQLQQRSKELRTIVCDLEDIKDWMAKYAGEMQSGLLECITQLDVAIATLASVKDLVDDKAAVMEAHAYSEQDNGESDE